MNISMKIKNEIKKKKKLWDKQIKISKLRLVLN